MSVLQSHSAPGQLEGYLWQFDRALINLLASPDDEVAVAVETFGDVALLGRDGNIKVAEEDKSAVVRRNNLTDGSINLWRTLATWAQAAEAGEVDLNRTTLILATRAMVGGGLIRQIANAKTQDEAQAVAARLSTVRLSSAAVKHQNRLLCASCDTLVNLIRCIELIDARDPNVKRGLAGAISHQFGVDIEKSEIVAEQVLGWFIGRVRKGILTGTFVCITRKVFLTQVRRLIYRIADQRIIEAVQVDTTPGTLEKQNGTLFVKQLELIGVASEDILKAIRDYLYSVAQRTRWAEEGDITEESLDTFDQNLFRRWKWIFNGKTDALETDDDQRAGRHIFRDTTHHREPLAGHPTEQFYTTAGRYHALANGVNNDLWVGWHPKFDQIFLAKGDPEDDAQN